MRKKNLLFNQLLTLKTEERNLKTFSIDSLSTTRVLRLINAEDEKVARAVRKEIPYISRAVELIMKSFRKKGRLIYVGAGTSGRLGVLDASECPPTFGSSPSMVQGIMAGGKQAVFRSQEGSEDRREDGVSAMKKKRISNLDTVCGIAASMRTPYVLGALHEAKRRGASVILVTTNPRSRLAHKSFAAIRKDIDVAICPEVGPEVLMGSTRMKSGTAQKLILNMMTTTAMIRMGKVFENMMVDLKMNSRKLEERAKRVLMISTGVSYEKASEALSAAHGHVKTAIVMLTTDRSYPDARKKLRETDGFVRPAIKQMRLKSKRSSS